MTKKNEAGQGTWGRRQFLRSGAAYVAAGVAGGALGGIGEGIYNTIFHQESQIEIDIRYLSSLFDIAGTPPSIYVGNGNILGRAIGILDVSGYLRFSAATLIDFISGSLSIGRNVLESNKDRSFAYDPNMQSIFLGHPWPTRLLAF
ncbi:MAG: hypothetical protein ACT4O2_06135 [Beijerinckiaceae bacterium]